MGSRGPVPKRSTERAGHRAKADRPDTIRLSTVVKAPPALKGWHAGAKRAYASLARSGQALYYEPSDWEFARLVCDWLSEELRKPSRSADGMSKVIVALGQLGMTESSRRRMRIEIEHPAATPRRRAEEPADAGESVAVLEQYRRISDG